VEGLRSLPAAGDDDAPLCYTALDLGLAVGAAASWPRVAALAGLRWRSGSPRSRTVSSTTARSSITRATNPPPISLRARRDTLLGIAVKDASVLAPVLQRSLCLIDAASTAACGGLRVLPDDPWYQTDLAMVASYVRQNSDLGRADDADANLVAVDFHSGLGVPFTAYRRFPALPSGLRTMPGRPHRSSSVFRRQPASRPRAM
jgi:hypothetical protein